MPTCLWHGTQILIRLERRKLATASLLFHFFMGLFASVFGMSFFSSVFQFLGWITLVLHFLRNRLQMDSKKDLIKNGLVFGFFLGIWLFSINFISEWIKTCKIFWNLFSFWWHQVFLITTLADTLVCSLNVLVLLSSGILQYRLIS